jgi:hypothetical protein
LPFGSHLLTSTTRSRGTLVMMFVFGIAVLIAVVSLLKMAADRSGTDTAATLEAVTEPDQARAPANVAVPALTVTQPHTLLPEDVRAVATVAGTLAVEPTQSQDRLTLEGRGLALPGPYFSLLAISRHPGEDIVLVGMNCGANACAYLDLAFVRLFAERAPLVEMRPEFRVPARNVDTLRRNITFANETTDVALGLDRGASVVAHIGPGSPLRIVRTAARIQPLSSRDCFIVRNLVRQCADFRERCSDASFREFPRNCPSATMSLLRTTSYLADHTTGLDLPNFAHTCTRASQLHIAPSDRFIRREICSGADPRQWEAPAQPQ